MMYASMFFFPVVHDETKMANARDRTVEDEQKNLIETMIPIDNYYQNINARVSVLDPNAPEMTQIDYKKNEYVVNPAQVETLLMNLCNYICGKCLPIKKKKKTQNKKK